MWTLKEYYIEEITAAGKYSVRCILENSELTQRQAVFLKFNQEPTQEDVDVALVTILNNLNDPITNSTKFWTNKTAFWAEFTSTEQVAIISSEQIQMKLLLEQLRMWEGTVHANSSDVIQGTLALVAFGIISTERRLALLTI